MAESILTGKCTLVPQNFFRQDKAREILSEVVLLDADDDVRWVEAPEWEAVLVYAAKPGREGVPELFVVLSHLADCSEYNKIVASHKEGRLYLAIAQGKSLLLANTYEAPDFTSAEYYIFLAMRSLQLNPEVSTICLASPVSPEEEMSLYRYFKTVEPL
ncbi:MAG: DUF3822 family protein [Bacteroidales bacterium]|nr:DUF3822 family protein [Bacteroidales bacterium]